jgi:hypothetical protein
LASDREYLMIFVTLHIYILLVADACDFRCAAQGRGAEKRGTAITTYRAGCSKPSNSGRYSKCMVS